MKEQIRKGVFETNSSSTHAICIDASDLDFDDVKDFINLPNELDFQLKGEFGWGHDEYHDTQSKANYLAMALTSLPIEELAEAIKFIIVTLHDYGVEAHLPEYKICNYTWKNSAHVDGGKLEVQVYALFDDEVYGNYAYIDHVGETEEFVRFVCSDKDALMSYLFSDKSFIVTGNDNDDDEYAYIDVDYPHDEFFKGN